MKSLDELRSIIRDVPDFPKEGIIFKDITTLLKDPDAFKTAVDLLYEHYASLDIDAIVSMESRGFIFGSVLAYKMGVSFVPIRKKGKLPAEVEEVSYELEYGTDTLEIHRDGISDGMNVLVLDDLLATGGTAEGVAKLVEKLGGKVISLGFLIELEFLKGKEKLKGYDVFSLIKF